MHQAVHCRYGKKRINADSCLYFWSDTFNAFIFGHGPASPTLADVVMLTGLDIATADDGQLFGRKAEFKVETHNIGGWSGYI